MPTKLPPLPGRPPNTLALCVRHRLWAGMVGGLCAIYNWGALDAYWLPKIDTGYPGEADSQDLRGRRRIFESIDRHGHDPSYLKGLNGTGLIEAVHADPRMADAEQMFESRLWNRLSNVPGTPADVNADWNHLAERWGPARLRSLFKAMSRFLHAQRMSVHEVRLLVEHAASLDSLVLLSCVHERGAHADGPDRRARYEAAVWFFLQCFLRRWCAYRYIGLAHLIATRLIDKDAGPWLEHERALGGFPVRQKKTQALRSCDECRHRDGRARTAPRAVGAADTSRGRLHGDVHPAGCYHRRCAATGRGRCVAGSGAGPVLAGRPSIATAAVAASA